MSLVKYVDNLLWACKTGVSRVTGHHAHLKRKTVGMRCTLRTEYSASCCSRDLVEGTMTRASAAADRSRQAYACQNRLNIPDDEQQPMIGRGDAERS